MRLLYLVVLALLGSPLWAAPRHFASGGNRTHLLELYSSEGCSSCPPAEAWLGGLRDADGLWRDFVPVAFHVDYWDRLGWRDRFASKEFTARQYAYSRRWGLDNVYTPGFVLDGAEWRPSGRAPSPAAEPAGILSVDYGEDGTCRIRYSTAGDHEVQVALLGAGIVSPVRSGENEGRTLRHDFVVLSLVHAPVADGSAEVKVAAAKDIPRRGLAVWIMRRGDPVPLQATGGWLD